MKFENKPNPNDKHEFLFQGFYLLFACPTTPHADDMAKIICTLLMDPEITKEHAQQACDRAMLAHINEKKLEETFNA